MHGSRLLWCLAGWSIAWMLAAGCATTGGSQNLPPPIAEGKGRLILDAGGINQLNFYVLDQETEEEVYESTPRMSASSPGAYESGSQEFELWVDLAPGTYTVVVNTDIKKNVELKGVEVKMGQEVYQHVPVGRFQLIFSGGEQFGAQVPFLIMDYNMRTVLGKGMTSSEIRHFIVPEDVYKIRIENLQAGLDEIRPVEVVFGRITPLSITIGSSQPGQPGSGTEGGGGQQ
ncbi:MAG: hypothetical protein HYW07_23925 [Candidatus Latescibacteria bacterium]|nr:hypothetical protein [Candidatus Latescibacterota bacterium]